MPVRQRGKDSYQVDVTHEGKRFRESFNGTKSNADIISAVVLDCMKHNKDIKSELQKLDPLVTAHEQEFSHNLSENELVLLNELLEKFRN